MIKYDEYVEYSFFTGSLVVEKINSENLEGTCAFN